MTVGGYIEMPRGLIALSGKEAVPFLDGMITNDVKTLEDGQEMLAAFPNAQGRLLAVVRVLRQGERFLVETEHETREKVFQNLFRFTFAGDFFVEDLTSAYRYFEVFGNSGLPQGSEDVIKFEAGRSRGFFTRLDSSEDLVSGSDELSTEASESFRVECGIPRYGVDMDETTIVPELGIDEMISYKKGCYIGQEIIARIHFRGHVAKRLTGLTISNEASGMISPPELGDGVVLTTDGKNAGRITSMASSRRLDSTIALAYVRYDHLAPGTELMVGDATAVVTDLPFIK